MLRNCRLIVLLLTISIGAGGCQRATILVGAVACQGVWGPVLPDRSQRWCFAGLDPRVPPRIRPGSYASATFGVRFLEPDRLGPHGYRLDWSERNGIVYTCRGGHIDIAHVRKAADWTGYLAAVTFECLEKGRIRFQFTLKEPSVYSVTLTVPPGWDHLYEGERERISREVSRRLGSHLAYTALTWHEILTWFGYRPKGYKSEFPSAFSWEDTYSNLLGVCIAGDALGDPARPFSAAVTAGLDGRLQTLGVQPAEVARGAAEAVRGHWYSRKWMITTIHERNFDVGLEDGCVTPSLVPVLAVCRGAAPEPLTVPTLAFLTEHGFSVRLEIEPRVWEQGRVLEALGATGDAPTRRIDPAVHFPIIMNHIEGLAARGDPHREPPQSLSVRESP